MSKQLNQDPTTDLQTATDQQKLLPQPPLKVQTFDESLAKAGGFGLFQIYSFVFLMFAMVSNGYMFYALPYLELFPDYICPPDIPNCDHTDHCKDKSIPIDWDSVKSLDNWVDRLNLDCAEAYQIGLIGSLYFAGWMVASLIVPRLGDIYGRKWPCWLSLLLSLPVYLGLMLSQNIYLTIVLFFLFGTAQSGRYQIAYVYISELTPVKYRNYIGSATQFMDSFTIMLIALYFRFMSKHWLPFEIYGISTQTAALIAVFFIPESPKYLYSKGKYEQARLGLAFIARFNRVKDFNPFKFPEEAQSDHGVDLKISEQLEVMKQSSDILYVSHSNIVHSNIEGSKINEIIKKSKLTTGIRDASFIDQDLLKENIQGTIISKPQGTLKELVKNKVLLPNLIIFCCLWIVSSFSYYLILFQLKYLEGDIYINTIVAAGAEMISYALVSFSLQKFGIKATYCVSYIIGSIGSVLYIIYRNDSQLLVAIFILGAAFGISSSCITNWTATVQLFPVIYASTTVGACNFFCRLVNILVPQFAEIAQPLPMIIVASACVFAAVVVLFLNTNTEKVTKI